MKKVLYKFTGFITHPYTVCIVLGYIALATPTLVASWIVISE